jgi:hypothetical protein
LGNKSKDNFFVGSDVYSINSFISWAEGYKALNPSPGIPTFPISNIWFNDHRAIVASLFTTGSKTPGWLETAMATIQTVYGSSKTSIPTVNAEWIKSGTPFPVVVAPSYITSPRINLYAPNNALLVKLGTKKSGKWSKWTVDQTSFQKLQSKALIEYPGNLKYWVRVGKGCVQLAALTGFSVVGISVLCSMAERNLGMHRQRTRPASCLILQITTTTPSS